MSSFAHMRAFVTGGAGFIGSHLVDALVARGASVAVLDNCSTGDAANVPEGVRLYEAHLQDRAAVHEAVAQFRPTHVFHQAAQASVSASVAHPVNDADVNIVGGLHLLDAARDAGVRRVVFASTGGALYGEVTEGAADESRSSRPKSPYGASKAAFETYLDVYKHNFGLPYTVLRYANVYGPRQNPLGEAGVVAIFISRLLAGEPVTLFARRQAGDEGGVRDYVWVGDVVEANLVAAARDLDGAFNVGTGIGTTTRDLLAAVEKATGMAARVRPEAPRQGDLERSVVDVTKLKATGWRPTVSLQDGIEQTVAAFRGNDSA